MKSMEFNGEVSHSTQVSDISTEQGSVIKENTESIPESLYYFESDHLALKGNPECQALLRTIALLEAQRTQAIQDLEKLVECEGKALADPVAFVAKLQHNPAELGLPSRQNVAELPNIQWENYTSNVDPATLTQRHSTRRGGRGSTEDLQAIIEPPSRPATPNTDKSSPCVIRGRVRGEHKPNSFNQLWTNEEQARLEECLITFPPEEVEARRWSKIANALGNRTAQQVASRVQKYFIKLAKAGLPIPGRMPNMSAYGKKASVHRHQRFNRLYFQPSTFLASYEPPVYMSEDEDDLSSWAGSQVDPDFTPAASEMDLSDEEDVSPELRGSPEYAELQYLKRLKRRRLHQSDNLEHVGYKCDRCQCEPIVGTRWHCTDCPVEESVDFCDECVDFQHEVGLHNSSHRLEPIQPPGMSSAHLDSDYTRFMPGDYSYLDPNFMPAS